MGDGTVSSAEEADKHVYKIIERLRTRHISFFSSECASFRCFEEQGVRVPAEISSMRGGFGGHVEANCA